MSVTSTTSMDVICWLGATLHEVAAGNDALAEALATEQREARRLQADHREAIDRLAETADRTATELRAELNATGADLLEARLKVAWWEHRHPQEVPPAEPAAMHYQLEAERAQRLQERVHELEADISALKAERDRLRDRVRELGAQRSQLQDRAHHLQAELNRRQPTSVFSDYGLDADDLRDVMRDADQPTVISPWLAGEWHVTSLANGGGTVNLTPAFGPPEVRTFRVSLPVDSARLAMAPF